MLLVFLSVAQSALSADFTGLWNTTDMVCKYACTKEAPDPDFEIQIGYALIQRANVVCGYHTQNSLADNVVTIPLRGKVHGNILELEEGEPDFGNVEEGDSNTTAPSSKYPFRVAGKTRFELSGKELSALTDQGNPYMTFAFTAFNPGDINSFLQENKAYFDACFSYK